ncbi:MAG: CPBP family intramembrane glutamic endopeptidase [Acidimicrobiales bacterium]
MPRSRPWGIGEAVGAYLGGIFVAIVAGSIAISAGAGTTDSVTTTVTFLGEWVGFVGVPLWLARTRDADFGLRLDGVKDVAFGLVAGFGIWFAVAVYAVVLRQFDHVDLGHEAQQLSGHGLGPGFLVFAVVAGVGAPFAEEIFFRGLAQPALQDRLGGVGGLVLTSALFGLAHASGNPAEAIPALSLVGLVVGTLAWRTARLGPGIVAHITFNSITVASLALSR